MLRAITLVMIGVAIWGSLGAPGARAGEEALAPDADAAVPTAPQTCRRAEVNPVTGHVFCFDPLGALVEPPPAAADTPCKPGTHKGEAWTFGPKCKS